MLKAVIVVVHMMNLAAGPAGRRRFHLLGVALLVYATHQAEAPQVLG